MLYGLLGVGLVLVYRSSRIINFAYGDIGVFGAALLGVAVRKWGVPYWIAFFFALIGAAGVGAASEVLVVRRLRAAPLVITVIATLGLGQVISILSAIVDSNVANGQTYPQPSGFPEFSVGALLMTPAYSATMIVSPVMVAGLAFFLRRGRLGVALRCSAANPDAARMSGMLVGRLSALAWAISGAVAGLTAIFVLPTRGFSNTEFLGPDLLVRGLMCAVVARMSNLPIALAAGLGLGVVEQLLFANYPSGGTVEIFIFVVIVAVLLIQRPTRGRGEDKGSWSAVQAFSPLPRSFLQVPAIRNLGWAVAATGAAAFLAIPELTSNLEATTFTLIVAFGIVGLSITVVTGLGGQLSLGQFAIAGVGAVASYWVTYEGAPFILGPVSAAAAAAAVSLVIGVPALRLRGLMLAVVSLGFALAAEAWIFEQRWAFGTGVYTRRPVLFGFSFDTGKHYYLIAFALLLVAVWMARNIWRSGIGRLLRAVRDNEDTARTFTVNATAVTLQTFVLGGVLAGLGGAVYGHLLALQSSVAYPVDLSTNVVASAVVGGLGVMAGPLLGSLYIIGLPQWLPLDNAGVGATAAGWLILILVNPGGVAQSYGRTRDRLVDWLARRGGLDPAAERAVTPGGGMHAAAEGIVLRSPESRTIPSGQVLLRAQGLRKAYGGLVAVDDVTLDVRAGEIVGLIGPNGAGKTTLFELLGGYTRPDHGTILFQDRNITRASPEQRGKQGLIRSFQDAALFPTMTVHEALMVAFERTEPTRFLSSVAGLSTRRDRRKADRADDMLAVLGLLSYRDTKISALSTGTRRIAELACLISLEPVLLLLDEPTSGIAQRESEALGDLLRNIQTQLDLTMVIIEHDIPLIMGLADRVVAMESGKVITEGSPAAVQADPRVIESYLGGDMTVIERSDRTTAPSPDIVASARCSAVTRSGKPCTKAAGSDGLCAQHRKVFIGS
jgi:ABC-type branched-subunit amino acid transport system ATPase component/ABC-type branched-subunit amino acid transport system permease subunit